MFKKGKFIVVEGLEGAGKTTAVQIIQDFLITHNKEVVLTREPGGTILGESLRNIVKMPSHENINGLSELLIMYAARVQHIQQVILPAMQQGKWVISDRFELSTYAYQGGGRGLELDVIDRLSTLCLQGFTPDLTIFLHINPQEGLKRAALRGKFDRFEQEPLDFFEKIAQAYETKIEDNAAIKVVNADQSISVVKQAILQYLQHFIQDE